MLGIGGHAVALSPFLGPANQKWSTNGAPCSVGTGFGARSPSRRWKEMLARLESSRLSLGHLAKKSAQLADVRGGFAWRSSSYVAHGISRRRGSAPENIWQVPIGPAERNQLPLRNGL